MEELNFIEQEGEIQVVLLLKEDKLNAPSSFFLLAKRNSIFNGGRVLRTRKENTKKKINTKNESF